MYFYADGCFYVKFMMFVTFWILVIPVMRAVCCLDYVQCIEVGGKVLLDFSVQHVPFCQNGFTFMFEYILHQ